jgi:ATP-dependent protease ClpP protease subunit
VTRIIGFATLPPDADPATTFVSADAVIRRGDETMDGRLFVIDRKSACAVGFEIDADYEIERDAIGRNLTATAFTHLDENSGLLLVDELVLHRGGPTAWRADLPRDCLDDHCRGWFPHLLVASTRALAGDVIPLPPDARPEGDGIAALDLTGEIADIEAARGQSIALEIDSPGGNLHAATRIFQALARHDRCVRAQVVRHANSAAVLPLCAGDVRTMERNGSIYLHEPHLTLAEANTGTLRAAIGRLNAASRNMAALIAKATGQPVAIAQTWLETEIVFNAGEAYNAGWIHRVTSDHVPAAPTARRARFAPINGPYASIRAAACKAPRLFAYGERYQLGERVRHGSRIYTARRATFAAPGLEPDRNVTDWK